MPMIKIEMFEGRTPHEKRALVAAVTEACVRTIGSPPESVHVLLVDVPKSNWATGGVLWSERNPAGKLPA